MRLTKIALLELFVFISCILGVIQVFEKSGLPFQFYSSSGQLFIKSNSENYNSSDELLKINQVPVNSMEAVEFIMDGIKPGEQVNIQTKHLNANKSFSVNAVPFYTTNYIIISIISGFSFFFMGIIVFHKGKNKKSARIFHLASLATAVTILCTWGNYNFFTFDIGIYLRILFHFAYLFTPVLFFHFALAFPQDKSERYKKFIYASYILAAILFFILSAAFLSAVKLLNSSSINIYLLLYNILRAFVLGGILSSIIIFAANYRSTQSIIEKKKLKWLLLGFIFGPFSYVFLWIIPQSFQVTIIPEEIILLLMISVPLTFSISIIKYHILDVDHIINRSIVYSALLTILGFLYFLMIYILTSSIQFYYQHFPSVVSAFGAALIYQPLRKYVQRFVDKRFFLVQYDFREALNRFFFNIKEINDISVIGDIASGIINTLIPLKEFALLILDDKEKFYYSGKQEIKEIDFNKLNKLKQYVEEVSIPFADSAAIEPEVIVKSFPDEINIDQSVSLIYPLLSQENKILGFLIIGQKKSNHRFGIEDTDLFASITLRISLAIERINLQRQLITELLEKEKFAELDKLKSFFISGISHELKTPITTIKMYAEILEDSRERLPEEQEYLNIIDGECNRLARLIDNLLDISRIERGEKKFQKEICELGNLIRTSLKIIEYQRKIENCEIEKISYSNEVFIYADPDAIISAIVNLLTNAIKYSYHPKKVKIEYGLNGANTYLTVTDNGPGINDADIKFIMTPYFRTKTVKEKNIAGMGIGLALVKHIIDGHNGEIDIKTSEKGACFTILIPQYKHSLQGAEI